MSLEPSWISEGEFKALQMSDLHLRGPFVIYGVSRTIFSTARHFGVAKVNGESFTYFPKTDELIRDDVVRWLKKRRKKAKADADGEKR